MTERSHDTSKRHLVGVLGGARVATVDHIGAVRPERGLWALEWWVGADDRWRFPAQEAAVRQSLVGRMPVVRTVMKVPGGDAVHEVFGATGDSVVVDVDNQSPAPFVVAFAVRGATTVALDDTTVFVDGVPALTALRPPSRWATATDGSLRDLVAGGGAHDGAMRAVRDRRACVDAAFLFPVAHRTRLRVGVALGRHDTAGLAALDLTAVPSADAVVRGWEAQLDRGMRVALPDPALQGAVEEARAQVLLAGQAWRGVPSVYAALEDWGFDHEALGVWTRLGLLDRRRAGRRSPAARSWADLLHRDGFHPIGVRASAGAIRSPAQLLSAVRDLVVRDEGDVVTVFPQWPPDWWGQPVDVRDAPTRAGAVSCSVRWHGDRPAVLWTSPGGVELRAPGLDPSWSTREPAGETLLAARA